jgi:hypothetical protein
MVSSVSKRMVILQSAWLNQFFVGFLGLNNGDGTGSMDSWISHSFGDIIGPTGTASVVSE